MSGGPAASDADVAGAGSAAPAQPHRRIATVTLLVRDYDEAIAWYCGKLGFRLADDVNLGGDKRWVVVTAAAEGSPEGARLLLARPDDGTQIGNQTAGRVAFFLETDDFAGDHDAMLRAGVAFREEPRHESYGTVAVFADLYGNLWDLIQPKR